MADPVRHLEVELQLLPTEMSGRRAPIFTGFNSTFHYDCGEWSAYSIFEQLEFVFPGERASAFISFRTPRGQKGLTAGKAFSLREGNRIIARGTVTRVLDPGAAA